MFTFSLRKDGMLLTRPSDLQVIRESKKADSQQEELRRMMSRILIVDDDHHIRELIRVFLQKEGFDICRAADGVAVRSLIPARAAPPVC